MAPETVLVRCSTCGKEIGNIAYIPGEQVIGCSYCGGKTKVWIKGNGDLDTRPVKAGSIPRPSA